MNKFIILTLLLVQFFKADITFAENGPVLLIIGTRPEAIKVIPVYEALKKVEVPVEICSTGQHIDLVNEIFALLKIVPEYSFNIMKPGQDLCYIAVQTLAKTTELIKKLNPSLVVVQGDTSSAMAAGLAAFYCKVPVAHVEAGLRTKNIYAPFPEEMNRQMIGRIASLHFTPTALATKNLLEEGTALEQIYETGNTVVDALYLVRDKIINKEILPSEKVYTLVEELKEKKQKIFLLTAHRRESIEGGMEEAMNTIYTFLQAHPDVSVIFPVHPNPKIAEILDKTKLSSLPNMKLLPPVPYNDLVYLLLSSKGVLTDSGGIQEEAVSLKKPTLVLRNETDRPEGLAGGIARLVGTDAELIEKGFSDILALPTDPFDSNTPSPYGDGLAADRIARIIKLYLTHSHDHE